MKTMGEDLIKKLSIIRFKESKYLTISNYISIVVTQVFQTEEYSIK